MANRITWQQRGVHLLGYTGTPPEFAWDRNIPAECVLLNFKDGKIYELHWTVEADSSSGCVFSGELEDMKQLAERILLIKQGK